MSSDLGIQRIPLGLLETFGVKGLGKNPNTFSDEVRGVIETLHMYARSQRQTFAASLVAAGVGNGAVLTVPDDQTWVLLHCACLATQTATMTNMRLSIRIDATAVLVDAPRQYGATVTGPFRFAFFPPYPYVLGPRSILSANLDQLGTDATADFGITALVGVMQ